MHRSRTTPTVDKEVFTRTAAKSKSINLGAKVFRGGTRL